MIIVIMIIWEKGLRFGILCSLLFLIVVLICGI